MTPEDWHERRNKGLGCLMAVSILLIILARACAP